MFVAGVLWQYLQRDVQYSAAIRAATDLANLVRWAAATPAASSIAVARWHPIRIVVARHKADRDDDVLLRHTIAHREFGHVLIQACRVQASAARAWMASTHHVAETSNATMHDVLVQAVRVR